MNLVGFKVKIPNGFVVGDARGHCGIIRGSFRQIIPEHPCIPAPAGASQLNLGKQPVPALAIIHIQHPVDVQGISCCIRSQNLDQERRELVIRSRRWDMLIPQGGESVICRYEQIVTGDPGQVIKWWTVRLNYPCERFPTQLLLMGQRAPGPQSSQMDCGGCHLTSGPRECGSNTAPEEALAASVIGGHITGRTVCITDENTGAQLYHKS